MLSGDQAATLAALRASLAAVGITAGSPREMDGEAEQLAHEERWT